MNNEFIVNYIKNICKRNIERIDLLSENDFANDVDIGMCYVYRKILKEIEDIENEKTK